MLYFTGCSTDLINERVGDAVLTVLTNLGYEVIVPQDQRCCSVPIFLSGARKEALPNVRKNLSLFDRDDAGATYTVVKRGHARRLLVDGRFALGDVSEIKSHGLLAHLPLSFHDAPKRVCLVGTGNGMAARAALSHPIERLDVLAFGGAARPAAESFGSEAAAALADPRARVHTGDPADLLARLAPPTCHRDSHAQGAHRRHSPTGLLPPGLAVR